MLNILKAKTEDVKALADLFYKMWNSGTLDELEKDILENINSKESEVFVGLYNNEIIGGAIASLRNDYVEGTESSPVGYLEGIYIKEEFRNKNIAKRLSEECESWAKENGCVEFASDCELSNAESLKFHLAIGFEEANRIICFTKKLL